MEPHSGAGPRVVRPSPGVLRCLPRVHGPPARVLVVGAGSGHEARALDARGYRVTVVDLEAASIPDVLVADFLAADFAGAYDLLCEHGAYAAAPASAYVAAAARALRPGGQVFGVFPGSDVGGVIRAFSSAFEPLHLEGSAADPGLLEAVFGRR